MSFSHLKLAPPILKAVTLCGYTEPTPVQEQAIPMALAGHDLIASAQTGTGKTAAFVLPALQRLSMPSTAPAKSRGPRVLVLTPTRELANQVTEAVRTYGKFMQIRSGVILGGMPYYKQQQLLSRPVDMIVATPGRLMDHMERGRIDFSRLELLVLDEADRMLDMGFSEAVSAIVSVMPESRQTLLFTATWDKAMQRLAQSLLRDAVRVEIAGKKTTLEQIEQRLHTADDMRHKNRMLESLIADSSMTRAIIFSATKRNADKLASELYDQGHSAAALHGDMNQSARNRTIMNMRSGKIRLLVATDVASRGLDLTGVTHVINYDLPNNVEDYVHRIGRTGRAGAPGIAISFANFREADILQRIERYIGEPLPLHVIPGLEPARPMRRSSGNRSRPSWSRGNPIRTGGRTTEDGRRNRAGGRNKTGGWRTEDGGRNRAGGRMTEDGRQNRAGGWMTEDGGRNKPGGHKPSSSRPLGFVSKRKSNDQERPSMGVKWGTKKKGFKAADFKRAKGLGAGQNKAEARR
jgi:superfamily II DNA/RNA helicase